MMLSPTSSPRPPNRYRPRIENLEDRSLLACTIVNTFPTLLIYGDGQPNEIVIDDDGTNSFQFVGDNIHVRCRTGTNTITESFDGPYTEIRVVAGRGSDTVTYNLNTLTSSHTTNRGVTRKLDVQLNRGKDTFVANLQGTVPGPGPWFLFDFPGPGPWLPLYDFPGSSYSPRREGGPGE